MTQSWGPDDVVARLSDEVSWLGGRLQEIGAELRAAQAVSPVPVPGPAWPSRPVLQQPPQPQPTWAPAPVWSAPPAWVPVPPRPPRVHWWQREGAAGRALALAGSAVTLLGVVLLLVLAAQGGWLGPVPRVVGGAVLSAGLVGLAPRVRRREGGRPGSVALAGTGAAGLYLSVVAATAVYEWLPDPVGLLLAAAVAAAGLALAHRWDSQVLAVVVVAGAAVLSPALAPVGTLALVAFLLAVQVASAPVQLRHRWTALLVLRTVPPAFAALLAVPFAPDDAAGRLVVVLTALAVTGAGLGLALLGLHRDPADRLLTAALAVAVGPSLVAAPLLERAASVAVTGGLAVVLVGVVVVGRWLSGPARATVVALAGLALFQASATAVSGDSVAALLLAECLVLTALAHRVRSRSVLVGAVVYGVLGATTLAARFPLDALLTPGAAVREASVATLLAAVLAVAAAVALALEVRWSHVLPRPEPAWWVLAAGALHASTVALVSGAVLLAGRDGFVVGQGAATVVWVVVGLALLARAGQQPRAAGLVLVAAALAKLLLFDLAALNGVVRVAAFLVTGLLLLWRGALAREHVVPVVPSTTPGG